eukprot:5892680-Ditylum_brightwellii.AAC.1
MEAALFQQHVRHFSQAMGTPFTTGPLDIDTLDTDIYTKEFLKELQRNDDNPPEINCTITTQDIKSNYKNWAEVTSTSPSNQYLGLYKSWLQAPDEVDDTWEGLMSNEFFGIVEKIVKIA